MLELQERKHLIWVLLLAFVLRFGFVVIFNSYPVKGGDGEKYDRVAQNLVGGRGFTGEEPDEEGPSDIAPVYPLFLATVYSLFGHKYEAVRFLQAIVASFTCLLVYLISKQIMEEKNAFQAGIVAAVYIPFIMEVNILYTETVFTFLLAISMYFLVRAVNESSIKLFVSAGALFGLSALCRNIVLYYPFFVLLAVFFIAVKLQGESGGHFFAAFKKSLLSFIVFLFTMAVVLAPWAIRNRVVLQRDDIIITKGIETTVWTVQMQMPKEKHMLYYRNFIDRFRKLYHRPHGLLYIRGEYTAQAMDFLRGKVAFSEMKESFHDYRFWTKLIILTMYCLIMGFSLIGFFSLINDWKRKLVVFSIIAYFTVACSMVDAFTRLVFPIMPYFIIFAVCGWGIVLSAVRWRSRPLVAGRSQGQL